MDADLDADPDADPIVIVGGGAAAQKCASSYREAGGDRPVVMLSADTRPPYFRPLLTKEYLRGEAKADELPLEDDAWYADHGVDLRLHSAVSHLDVARREVVVGDDAIAWWACVLATGSHAGALPVPGGDDPDLLTIRQADDTERVLAAVANRPGPIVVVGSGFVGSEAAVSLAQRGLDVTVVSAERLPQVDRLGPDVGALLEGWLRDAGIALHLDRNLAAIERAGDGWVVRLEDDDPLEGAHVLVAAGAKPNIELAAQAGLDVDGGGVVVTSAMRTSGARVLAVGDIAFAMNDAAGRSLRVEHWGDAEAMGAVAGQVLTGAEAAWRTVPGFWSTLGERTLKYAAWGDGWDDLKVERSAAGITVWYAKGGVTVGVLTHEHDDDYELGTEWVTAGRRFPPR